MRVLNQDKSERILTELKVSTPRISDQEYLNVLNKLDSLDDRRQVLFRKEQSYLRNKVLGGRFRAPCGLCQREYPVELLVAAHIKPRTDCSDKEKRDLANILPMCKFGCDDLFEKRYVSVSRGRIEANDQKATTQAVAKYVRKLAGRKCKHWNRASAPYFSWRKEHAN